MRVRLCLVALFAVAARLGAATFTVTNVNDSGAGSLRQAILDANANAGADTIAFNIPGAGVHTITPASMPPTLGDPVLIDGYTQPGATPNTDPLATNAVLKIELDGSVSGGAAFQVFSSSITIQGLVINRWQSAIQTLGNNCVIRGNFIGTDPTGSLARPNSLGILINSGDAVVGGSAPADRNLLSGNGSIAIDTTGNANPPATIQGNLIGTDASGTHALPNTIGVRLNEGGGHAVGGLLPGQGNVVAFNRSAGVQVLPNIGTGIRNSIRGNSIHDNGGLGIDLFSGDSDPNPNDAGDTDDGANHRQNFPILQSVTVGASTHVVGKLDSTSSTTFDIDFYANPACSNSPREFLEGESYLGSTQVTTDGTGHAVIDVTLPAATGPGSRISATATDPLGNTSEFSQRIIFFVTPSSGPATGGTPLNVAGTDLADPATMTIGGVAVTPGFVSDLQLTATSPVLDPGTVNDITVATPDGTTGTLVKAFVADFLDVPGSQQFHSFVTTLVSSGITVGVGGGNYGVDLPTLRQQMAVFLLKAKFGLCYTPPPCNGAFGDVACPSTFANWIEALAAEGITGGCGGGNYCPTSPVRRDQMAVFLLKAEHGSSYLPPACAGTFPDVPCPSAFADWIEQLAAENITGGCGAGNYCPGNPNTRGQMAVFIVKTFSLQ